MEAGLVSRNHAAVGEKATARLTLRFIRGGKRSAQSQQFRLCLIKSDSGSLTIVRRSSINYARNPQISDLFVPQIVNRNPEIVHAPAAQNLESRKFRLSDSQGVRQLSRRADAKKRRLDLPSAH
jgi:hypothetical protein